MPEVSGPIQELKGFTRLTLQPGERKTVTFTLHTHQLGCYDTEMLYAVNPGIFEVLVGDASNNLPLVGRFEVAGQRTDASHDKVFFSRVTVE